MKTTLKRAAAVAKIRNAGGKIFGATVVKRTTGEVREFRARLASSVKVGKAGGELAYNASQHGLIPVYLMSGDENRADDAKKNFRMIATEGLKYLAIDGEEFEIVD